jgi:hypothetical protein
MKCNVSFQLFSTLYWAKKKVLRETEILAEGYSFHKKQDGLFPGDIQFQYGGVWSRDGVVGMAPRYGLEGPGIESR